MHKKRTFYFVVLILCYGNFSDQDIKISLLKNANLENNKWADAEILKFGLIQ